MLVYTVAVSNRCPYALNGVQVVLTLPAGLTLLSPTGDTLTQRGQVVTLTLGRLAIGQTAFAQIRTRVTAPGGATLTTSAALRSATAQTVPFAAPAATRVLGPAAPTLR